MSAHVTVGYDGTDDSREAVMWAADEAAARGVPLEVVACYHVAYLGDPIAGYPAADAIEAARESTDAALAGIAREVAADHPELDVTPIVSDASPQAALLAGVDADDLLVVGASRHHGAAAFWLGSTPRAVARHSPCPVVVVRGAASRGRPNSIVVGIDGSPAADGALRWACDEADLHRVDLVIVHAWDYPYASVDFDDSQARDLMCVDAARVLETALTQARDRSGASVTDVLIEASAANALLEVARDGDLLVLGSRGRGAVAAELFGSTVNSVLERAAVPVVIVRPHAE
jgi:nucleotide-binding universal stress UspA family protein